MSEEARLRDLLETVASGGLQAREEAMSRLLDEPLADLVAFALARIGEGDFRLRNAAIELLGRAGPRALTELRKRLQSATSETKMFVAPVLAEYHDPRAVNLLHEWLEEDDPNLVATACEALGKIGDPRSLAPLARLVNADPWLAGPALMALGHLGQPQALKVMLDALAREELEAFAVGALGLLGVPEGWPHIAEAVRREPSLAAIALEYVRPIFERIGPEAIRSAAQPESLWLAAARLGLERVESRYAAVRILGALLDCESIPRLADLYLQFGEDESIPSELVRMPGAGEYVLSLLQRDLSDEETRRLVRLLFLTVDNAGDHALHLLTHPSPSVRLEMVLFLGARGRRYVGSLVGLLADPEGLVRRSALQTLKVLWRDAATATAIADELDMESVPPDILEALAREAPEPIPTRITTFLQTQALHSATDPRATLRTLLEARREPDRVLERLRRGGGRARWDLATLEMLATLPKPEAAELLLQAAVETKEALGYAAAEALAQHPYATTQHLLVLLRKVRDPGAQAVAFAWAEKVGSEPGLLDAVLAALPPQDPYVAAGRLRALAALDAAVAREAAAKWASEDDWYLQLTALRTLAGDRDGNALRRDDVHPLAAEVLQASL